MARGDQVTVAYFVSPSEHFAGIERVVHEVASGLAGEHGDELDVHVIFSNAFDEPVLRDTPYTQHVLGADRLRTLPRAVRAAVARIRPDVLVVPQVEAAVTVWLATRGLGNPAFVTHLHGNPRVEEGDGTRRTKVAYWLYRHLVGPRAATVLAVSPSLARAAETLVGCGRPVRYVPNPVRGFGGLQATGSGTSGTGTTDDGVLRLVCVARLSYQKGQDLLLEALALARPDLPPVHLSLVGSGDTEPELRRRCTELGLDDVVTFEGYATDPVRHLVAADAFVLASRWEGFGVALVEALDLGLPLVATDCEFGPADIITSPEIGELAAPEDPASLAAALVRLAGRAPDLARPEAVSARRAVAAGFSRSEVTASHLSVLREALAHRQPARRRLAVLPTRGVR
ncbi:glycosyltransferase [Quadrisphaera granulorum]|nr:glycosyltransferase [Quadrisphaera granulorum]